MAEIRHLENRHDVIFIRWSDLDKISQTGPEWHVDCGDMAKIDIKFIRHIHKSCINKKLQNYTKMLKIQ